MPPLPPELLDVIVDQVDDPLALQSCSLAARRLVTPSQRALFRSVRVQVYPQGVRSPHEALQARLVASPHLALFIHELEIYLLPTDAIKYAVAFTLRSLPNLTSLDIAGNNQIIWENRVDGIVDSLENLISQASLQRLAMSNIRNITASFLLRSVTSVSFLSVHMCKLNAADASPSSVLELPVDIDASLTSLAVREEFPGVTNVADVLLRAPACLTRLERLHVQFESPQRFLLAVPPSLQHLRIDDVLISRNSPHILPPSYPMLRTLELSVVLLQGGNVPALLPAVFAKLAEDLPSVEVIVLHCWRSADRQYRPLAPSTLHFPRLREVRCALGHPSEAQRLCAALQETIPALRGLVTSIVPITSA
ncbi:hypothetical protein C8J57DRAFT_1705934 [Mycena rebaudengoi]|nr:hypothetical protein C8J57DRAFT_1705934 [Mycena rebaudengoi]